MEFSTFFLREYRVAPQHSGVPTMRESEGETVVDLSRGKTYSLSYRNCIHRILEIFIQPVRSAERFSPNSSPLKPAVPFFLLICCPNVFLALL